MKAFSLGTALNTQMSPCVPTLCFFIATISSSLASSMSGTFLKVPVLEGDWVPLPDTTLNVAALTKSLATCPMACLLMGDQCTGFLIHSSSNSCTLGRLDASVEYLSEFEEDGSIQIMIKKEKVSKILVTHLVSITKNAKCVVLPEHKNVPKTEIQSVPGKLFYGAEPNLIQRFKEGIIKCGGISYSTFDSPSKECWQYSFATKEWTSLSPTNYGHFYGSTIFFRGKYWTFGGGTKQDPPVNMYHYKNPDRYIEVYHPTEDRWEDVGLLPFAIYKPSLVAISDKEILVVGGYLKDRVNLDTSQEFNVETKVFGPEKKIPFPEPTRYCQCTLIKSMNSVLCAGGQSASSNPQRGVCLYDLEDKSWTCPTEMFLPEGNIGGFHIAGDRILFTGGTSKKVYEFHSDGIPEYWEEIMDADLDDIGLTTYHVMYTHYLQ